MKSISKGMINFFRTCLAATMIVFTLGCLFKNPSYPTSWPQTTGSNDIESRIEGSFYCSGDITESHMGLWDMKSITDFLVGGLHSPTCNYVEIRKVQPDEMEIRFMSYPDKEVMKRNYKKDGDYHVEDNWIVLKPCFSGAIENVVVALGSVTPYLTIDVDQGLVIRGKSTSVGLIFLLIPVGGSGTDWGRFNRKE